MKVIESSLALTEALADLRHDEQTLAERLAESREYQRWLADFRDETMRKINEHQCARSASARSLGSGAIRDATEYSPRLIARAGERPATNMKERDQ